MSAVARKGIVAAIETFHVRRVKHNTVDLAFMIREIATVGTALDVRRKKLVFSLGDALPENPLPKSHVGNFRAARNV